MVAKQQLVDVLKVQVEGGAAEPGAVGDVGNGDGFVVVALDDEVNERIPEQGAGTFNTGV